MWLVSQKHVEQKGSNEEFIGSSEREIAEDRGADSSPSLINPQLYLTL